MAMLGGGAGTLASLGELGLATQERMAAHLGMRPMPLPARTIGDHQAEYVLLLGMLAATSSKIGREIYTLMKQEFGEVEEPVPPGTVGSSTMPQKRNPKLSQDIIAAAAQIRALVPLALEAMQTEHEADRTTSIMMSRAIVQACELTGDMLQRMMALFDGLQVFPDRMRQNLDLSGGLIMAEALMLELGKQIGRQRAHDAVYEAAQGSVTEGRPFREMLALDPHVSAGLTPSQMEALLDPARYAGLCREFAERGAVAGRAASPRRSRAGPSVDDRDRLDLHHQVGMGELAHLHRGAGRQRTEVLHAHVHVLEELLDVGHVGIGLHDVVEGGAGRGQRRLDVLAHLAKLRAHVAGPDDVAARASGELARHEDRLLALDDHHVGVQHVAADYSLAEGGWLDVLSLHGDV